MLIIITASHVVWLMNRTGGKAVKGKTPFKLLYGRKPDLGGLREWGEEVLVHDAGGDKWSGHAKKGRWVRYDTESNGSRIWFPDSGVVKVEHNFWFVNSCAGLEGEQGSGGIPNEPQHKESLTQTTHSNTIPNNPLLTLKSPTDPTPDAHENPHEVPNDVLTDKGPRRSN
jgi:hypothetical protein